jgi:hypothetical protein
MTINCIDDEYHDKISSRKLNTFAKFKPYGKTVWRGEDEDGMYAVVTYKKGFLYVGVSETELGAEIHSTTVGTTDDILYMFAASDISTQDVLKFLDWEIDEYDILDW